MSTGINSETPAGKPQPNSQLGTNDVRHTARRQPQCQLLYIKTRPAPRRTSFLTQLTLATSQSRRNFNYARRRMEVMQLHYSVCPSVCLTVRLLDKLYADFDELRWVILEPKNKKEFVKVGSQMGRHISPCSPILYLCNSNPLVVFSLDVSTIMSKGWALPSARSNNRTILTMHAGYSL